MDTSNWKSPLQRKRIVNKIMDTLKRHLPFTGYERLHQLNKIAERVEQETYTAVTNQSEYSRKICFMMLTMETRLQNPMSSTALTGNPNSGDWEEEVYQKIKALKDLYLLDWQEEVYQKIKAMKDLYLLDLNFYHQEVISKLQQHISLPLQPKNEHLEKLKRFRKILESYMNFLQISKHRVLASHKDKMGTYEKQIIHISNFYRQRQQVQALHPPHMQSLQKSQKTHSQLTQVQSHENQMNLQGSMALMQQNNMGNLPAASRSWNSNAQRNMMNSMQPSTNLDPGQNSSMNSLQQVSNLQQNTVSGPQQVKLLPTQVRQSQPQLKQQVMLHMQSQPSQLQEPVDIQHRLPTACGIQQQNAIDMQQRLCPQKRVMPETSSTLLDSTAQTGNLNGRDWQEEVRQKIKVTNDMYLQDLRPTQGSSGAIGDPTLESGDWRAQLQTDSRQRIVNKIMDTLKRHLPVSGIEGLQELKKIAVRFEEKIYIAATSQSDYLRKVSLKMLTMETRSQSPVPEAMPSNFTANSVNLSDPGVS